MLYTKHRGCKKKALKLKVCAKRLSSFDRNTHEGFSCVCKKGCTTIKITSPSSASLNLGGLIQTQLCQSRDTTHFLLTDALSLVQRKSPRVFFPTSFPQPPILQPHFHSTNAVRLFLRADRKLVYGSR